MTNLRPGASDPLLGTTLGGRYRLIQRLGSGGMSTVYLARHVLIDRLNAIKTLRRDLARDPLQRDRFLREARAVNRVNHENIVEITDFGETDDGLVYLVMEYVPGESLLRLMGKEPFTLGRAFDVVAQIASALGRAHQMGVVHRDLKPENILLVQRKDRPDFVKLLDFGIAKILDAPSLTGSQQIFGTPGYIAPEYIQNATLDGRADLYSLGVIFYELVTGALPFDYEYPGDLLVKHVTEAPVPPSRRRRGLPPSLEAFVLRCLAKSPADRFRDAFHFVQELEALRAELSTSPVPAISVRPRAEASTSAETRPAPIEVPDAARVSAPAFGASSPSTGDAGRAHAGAPTERPAAGTAERAGVASPGPVALPASHWPSPASSEPGASKLPPRGTRETGRPAVGATEPPAGTLDVRPWRWRVDALAQAVTELEETHPPPSDVAEAWALATQTMEQLAESARRAEGLQSELDAIATHGRRARRAIGRAIDASAAALSMRRGELEHAAARRRALHERREVLRQRHRGLPAPEGGEAETLLWEAAAADEAVRAIGDACDALEAELGEHRARLYAESDGIERAHAAGAQALEAEMRRFEALSVALEVPLGQVDAYVQACVALSLA